MRNCSGVSSFSHSASVLTIFSGMRCPFWLAEGAASASEIDAAPRRKRPAIFIVLKPLSLFGNPEPFEEIPKARFPRTLEIPAEADTFHEQFSHIDCAPSRRTTRRDPAATSPHSRKPWARGVQ